MSQVGVVIPVLNRPARVLPLVKSFRSSCSSKDATLYLVAQSDDRAELEEIKRCSQEHAKLFTGLVVLIVPPTRRTWANKLNDALAHTSEPWLMLGGDDLLFRHGWVDKLKPYMEREDVGVIGTRDIAMDPKFTLTAHPIVSRKYVMEQGTVDKKGEIVHDGYDHNFPDTELIGTAAMRGAYLFAPDVVVEHLHPLLGKARIDDTYRLGQVKFQQDRLLFVKRSREFGFEDYVKL
jgi:hypothetical protein